MTTCCEYSLQSPRCLLLTDAWSKTNAQEHSQTLKNMDSHRFVSMSGTVVPQRLYEKGGYCHKMRFCLLSVMLDTCKSELGYIIFLCSSLVGHLV